MVVFVRNNIEIEILLATSGSVVEVKLPNFIFGYIFGPQSGVACCFQVTVTLSLTSGLSSG